MTGIVPLKTDVCGSGCRPEDMQQPGCAGTGRLHVVPDKHTFPEINAVTSMYIFLDRHELDEQAGIADIVNSALEKGCGAHAVNCIMERYSFYPLLSFDRHASGPSRIALGIAANPMLDLLVLDCLSSLSPESSKAESCKCYSSGYRTLYVRKRQKPKL